MIEDFGYNKILLYHIDRLSENQVSKTIHTFYPCIPEIAMGEYEDTKFPRICFSTSVIGCVNGLGGSMLLKDGKYNLYILEVDKDDHRLQHTKGLIEHGLVGDAFLSNEVWYTEELTLTSTPIQLHSFKTKYIDVPYIELERMYLKIIKNNELTSEQLSKMDIGRLLVNTYPDKMSDIDRGICIAYDLNHTYLSEPFINKAPEYNLSLNTIFGGLQ